MGIYFDERVEVSGGGTGKVEGVGVFEGMLVELFGRIPLCCLTVFSKNWFNF